MPGPFSGLYVVFLYPSEGFPASTADKCGKKWIKRL
jgi:hypothetical protein